MLRILCLAVAVSCSALACGGSVQTDSSPSKDGGAKTTLAAPGANLTPDTPFGTWGLVSLDGMTGGNGSTLSSGQLVVELRADGTALASQCSRAYYEPDQGTFRCGDAATYQCFSGTVVNESGVWRVDIPGLNSPVKPSRGEIVPEANDTLMIRYILPKYSAGHFVHIPDGSGPMRFCP